MSTTEIATAVNGVEVKITNLDGSWITHNFPANNAEEARNALSVISAILYEGQTLTSRIY
jgi:hypothetical protein